jgi:hypothetical protein
MKAAMNALDAHYAIGSNRQLNGDLRGRRGSTLQGKQADHQLKAIEQPMIRFSTQRFLLKDQGLLLKKQSLLSRQRFAQRIYGASGDVVIAMWRDRRWHLDWQIRNRFARRL